MKLWSRRLLVVSFLVFGISSRGLVNAGEPLSSPRLKLQITPDKQEISIHWQGKLLFLYTFGKDQFKPYVKELHTLRGLNVLRDAPADHLHHHGLMYAIRINGINFWEEYDEPGVEKPVQLVRHFSGLDKEGRPQAGFTQLIHWVAGADRNALDTEAKALLIEQRTLTLTVNEGDGEIALEWQADFRVGKYPGTVKLHGTDYNGLGLRLPKDFDHVAEFRNEAGLSYSKAQQRDVVKANWSQVARATDSGKVSIALFGHPSNPGGKSSFFSMRNPFAYLAVTQGLDKAPLTYKAGEHFSLRYLLTVHDSVPGDFLLQKKWKHWSNQTVEAVP